MYERWQDNLKYVQSKLGAHPVPECKKCELQPWCSIYSHIDFCNSVALLTKFNLVPDLRPKVNEDDGFIIRRIVVDEEE